MTPEDKLDNCSSNLWLVVLAISRYVENCKFLIGSDSDYSFLVLFGDVKVISECGQSFPKITLESSEQGFTCLFKYDLISAEMFCVLSLTRKFVFLPEMLIFKQKPRAWQLEPWEWNLLLSLLDARQVSSLKCQCHNKEKQNSWASRCLLVV